MNVELLVVPDCPHRAPAAALLRAALRDVGLSSVAVTTTVIDTAEQAERRGFTGPPTILIDGRDPFAAVGQPASLACRVYPRPNSPIGIPDLRMLREALKRAADAGASERGHP